MDQLQNRTCPNGSDLEGTHQPSEQASEFYHRNGSMKKLIYYTLRFVVLALWALAHPWNKREWRFAYAYFVFPVFFVGGSVLLMSVLIMLLFPRYWDLLLLFVWWCYMTGELYVYYIEGDGFKRWNRWIDHGGE